MMCVQTGSVKEHLTGKVIPEKIRKYMGSRRTECHKRNYEKSGRSVKDENRCLHPTDNLVGWPRFYASFDNASRKKIVLPAGIIQPDENIIADTIYSVLRNLAYYRKIRNEEIQWKEHL